MFVDCELLSYSRCTTWTIMQSNSIVTIAIKKLLWCDVYVVFAFFFVTYKLSYLSCIILISGGGHVVLFVSCNKVIGSDSVKCKSLNIQINIIFEVSWNIPRQFNIFVCEFFKSQVCVVISFVVGNFDTKRRRTVVDNKCYILTE